VGKIPATARTGDAGADAACTTTRTAERTMLGRKRTKGSKVKGGAAVALGAAGLFLFLMGAKRTLGGRSEDELWGASRPTGRRDPEETDARERL
jgi:hypothetical protein